MSVATHFGAPYCSFSSSIVPFLMEQMVKNTKICSDLFPSYNIDVYCECISGVHHGHYT